MIVRCPAKINTFLFVGPPDSSGYHPIRTEFQAIGLYDELSIEVSNHDSLTCIGLDTNTENTVAKALRLIREPLPIPPLTIVIQKGIPAQAGLGGGSSDAAGLIRYVRHQWPDIFSSQFSQEVATAVGADVSFFLVGGRARGAHYGEVLELLPDIPKSWILIIKPTCGVSTQEAYRQLDATPRDWRESDNEPYNDFEIVAPRECLEMIELLKTAGAINTMLCGSGSAVYGVFSDESQAKSAQKRIENVESWVVPTLSREESLWI